MIIKWQFALTGQTREACLLAKCFDEQVYREIVFWLMRWGFYTVTAREAHLCDERGSPATGKGVVCLWVEYAPQGGGKCLVAFDG